VIHDVATENMGALCVTEPYRSLKVPLATSQYEGAQQKADMAAMLLQDLGVSHRNGTQIHIEGIVCQAASWGLWQRLHKLHVFC
jgi:hypothetical protein